MSQRIRVGIIFGGRSGEHEVSLRSARSILEALDPQRYEPVLVGIDHDGQWHLQEAARAMLPAADGALHLDAHTSALAISPCCSTALVQPGSSGPGGLPIDVFFPVLHGTYGEDGTIQGLLEMADVAYAGSGVLGSAVGMDKDVAKRLLRDAGIPVVDWLVAKSWQREALSDKLVAERIGYPCFVKPANLGSSVGVHKVKSPDELHPALDDAFQYDTRLLIEKAVDAREIECAVLGNEFPEASIPGEIIPHAEFYSYEAKYIDSDGAALAIPANLTSEQRDRVRKLAVETFQALELDGMARVDFFLDRTTGELFVNEVNTIPGFTSISMYPKLWEASGLGFAQLVARLLELGIERHKRRRALRTRYQPDRA
jgi:D-alanine-D-alanine ligase